MKKKNFLIAAALLVGLCIYSCKKELNPAKDTVIQSEITPRYLNSIVLGAYTKLQPLAGSGDVYLISEATTDAMIIPVRIGGDWLDGDEHIQLWLHTYLPGHGQIGPAWQDIYNGIGQVNITIGLLQGLPTTSTSVASIAELKALRCYFYYLLLTNWGNVPYIISSSTNAATVKTTPAATLYQDLITELKADAPLLSSSTPTQDPTQYGRLNKWGVYFLLAKLYLNKNWITGSTDNSGYTACSAYCDSLMTAGYSLTANFMQNFASNNNVGNTENIFVIPFDHIATASNPLEIQMMTFHYNQAAKYDWTSTGGPWNGYCANADYYDKFNTADARIAGWQEGIQYAADGVTPLTTRGSDSSLVLNFRPQVTGFLQATPATEYDGVRQQKWQLTPGFIGQDADYSLFRYSDVLLMQAECQMRLGNTAAALTFTAPVRQRAGMPNFSPAAFTIDSLLAERGREFVWEGWRKEDMIRFGHFGDAKQFKPAPDPNTNAQWFPIPVSALLTDPSLTQNPGY